MPNHTTNIWEIEFPDAHQLGDFRQLMLTFDGHLTFDRIRPMPDALRVITTGSTDIDGVRHTRWIEEPDGVDADGNERTKCRALTDAEAAACDETGHPTWKDWRYANWGTKWDAYWSGVEQDGLTLSVNFTTAWSPPEPILADLMQRFPDAVFTGRWHDEYDDTWRDLNTGKVLNVEDSDPAPEPAQGVAAIV